MADCRWDQRKKQTRPEKKTETLLLYNQPQQYSNIRSRLDLLQAIRHYHSKQVKSLNMHLPNWLSYTG